jgi:hypothetical protein
MTQDERNMLQDLANKITQTPPPPKDAEAEDFIRTKIGSRPDALYIMTQTVLIQNLALQHAQEQINQLQRGGSQQLGSGGSFLGQGAAPPRGGYAQSGPQQQYAQPQYAPPQQQYAQQGGSSSGGGTGGFLRGAAQTAAGVAAGGLALEAINSMFHSGGGYGGFGGGGYGGAPVEETVVNNYYDQPGGGDYRADDASNFDDSNVDDSQQYDDSNIDTGDDGGGFDGGGFDGGGDNFV